jgi:hypothetical protein
MGGSMRPQWDNQIIQFNDAITQIRAVLPTLPQTFTTAQGVVAPTESLLLTLEELKAAMQLVNDSAEVDPLLLGIHQNGVLSAIPNIAIYAGQLLSSPSVAVIDQIAQQTWGIRASLVWLVPKKAAFENFESTISNFDFDAKLALLKTLTSQYLENTKQLKEVSEDANKKLTLMSIATEQIKGFEREASTAKTNAEASAATATANKDALTTQLTFLNEGIERYEKLLTDITTLKATAVSTLESTSKVALAASFSNRKDDLGTEQRIWQIAFGVGIVLLLTVGALSTFGWIALPPIVIDSKIELGPILTRFALIGPIVWFTWFAVRSLSAINRLIEDYAFKEASALAFVGYQREMKDDAEMIKLLRESAIHNFGNQPTRIFEKPDPASPLHDLFAKAFDTGGIDKVVDLIKALRPGK